MNRPHRLAGSVLITMLMTAALPVLASEGMPAAPAEPGAAPALPAPAVVPPQTLMAPAQTLMAPPLTAAPSQTPAAPPVAVAPIPVGSGWARVMSVRPVAGVGTVPPVGAMACTESVVSQAPTSGAGAVGGALLGAVVGSQVGSGAGQALATAAGAIGGAMAGDRAEANAQGPQVVRQCAVQASAAAAGYEVVYEYAGQSYVTVLAQHPGALIPVHLTPVGTAVPMVSVSPAPVLVSGPVVRTVPYWGSTVVVGVGGRWGPRGHGHRHWRY